MIRRLAVTLVPLALAACAQEPADDGAALASLDAELTAGNAADPAADPALRSALRDQIMVDPALAQQANADTVRPPTQPVSGALPAVDIAARSGPAEREQLAAAPPADPNCRECEAAKRALTLGALAEAQGGAIGACAGAVRYSAAWANRLPAGVPLYPDARVAEAAGADGAGCALRVVSFSTAAATQRLVDWYYAKARAAGFSAAHKADGATHVLAGTRAGGAFMVMMRPRAGGGTDVDLMADAGA